MRVDRLRVERFTGEFRGEHREILIERTILI